METYPITAVILARNEEHTIEAALNSAAFCNDVLVINDNSTDKTVTIAERHRARVIDKELKGDWAAQRNFALAHAHNQWVLFLDADERISDELREEVVTAISENNDIGAYSLKRRDFWWNCELRYGETSKVRNNGLIRLVRRGSGTWKGKVHEVFESKGKVKELHGFINHYPHPTLSEFIHDVNIYSSARARELFAAGKTVTLFHIIAYPLGKFIYTFLLLQGFRDGAAGFAYAFLMSFHSFLVRAKLYQYTYTGTTDNTI